MDFGVNKLPHFTAHGAKCNVIDAQIACNETQEVFLGGQWTVEYEPRDCI